MIFWLLYPILEAIGQWKFLISKGKKPFYLLLFIMRGWIAIVFGALVLDVQNDKETFVAVSFMVASFWIIFPLVMNYLLKKPWDYQGKNSGWLDKIPVKITYILKVVALVVAIYCYYRGLEFWRF